MEDLKKDQLDILDTLKQKETYIQDLLKYIEDYKQKVQSKDDKLLSINVLEYKIGGLEKKHEDELEELAKNSNKKIIEFEKISEETIKKEKMNLDHYIRSLKSELNKVTEKNKKIVYDNKHKIQLMEEIITKKEKIIA